MSTKITNGLGGTLDVTATAQNVELSDPTTGNINGNYIKFWNTGTSDAYVQINVDTGDFTQASAAIIPAGESVPAFRDPLFQFTVACATGETTTVKYSAF